MHMHNILWTLNIQICTYMKKVNILSSKAAIKYKAKKIKTQYYAIYKIYMKLNKLHNHI